MMRFWLKAILAAVVIIVGVRAGMFYLFDLGLCGSEEVSRLRSPDARHDAVVYTLNCGATTGYTTQVAVIRSGGATPNRAGNVVAIDNVVKVSAPMVWPRFAGSDLRRPCGALRPRTSGTGDPDLLPASEREWSLIL